MASHTEGRVAFAREFAPHAMEVFWDRALEAKKSNDWKIFDEAFASSFKHVKAFAEGQFGDMPDDIAKWSQAEMTWTANFIVSQNLSQKPEQQLESNASISLFFYAVILYSLSGYPIVDEAVFDVVNGIIAPAPLDKR